VSTKIKSKVLKAAIIAEMELLKELKNVMMGTLTAVMDVHYHA